jgi:hypothetical protein
MPENRSQSEETELELIPGDTYAVRAELKTLGAVWDRTERVWKIVPEKLPLAVAIVENYALAPPTAGSQVSEGGVDALADPFEDEGPRMVTLDKSDGNLYAARDGLRAIGANWDKERRVWTVREDKADYARAIVAAVTPGMSAPPITPATAPLPSVSRPVPAVPPPVVREERPAATVEPAQPARTVRPTDPLPPRTPSPAPALSSASELLRLGGLWPGRTRDGRTYLSGKLSSTVRILVFKNEFRSGDNQPAYVMYLAPVEQADESGNSER